MFVAFERELGGCLSPRLLLGVQLRFGKKGKEEGSQCAGF